MIYGIAITVGIAMLLTLLVVVLQRRNGARAERIEGIAQLEDVLRAAQLTNSSFFQSLDLVQKNLESLLARAESAEQRLRNLMLQPGLEKKDQYTAAALLLGEGQEPQRVASILNLPLPQVQIVRDLQKMAHKEKKSAARKKGDETTLDGESDIPAKTAARQEITAAHPIRLVDVIKRAANEAAQHDDGPRQFTGINA